MVLGLGLFLVSCSKAQEERKEEATEKILASMSLSEKIGQLFFIGIHGTEMNEDILFMLHQYHIGGVILFDRNLESREQIAKLNADLQKGGGEKAHLFIGIDQEGGTVTRGRGILSQPSAQRDLGNAGETESVRREAERTAKELKSLGLNVNFAPVADVGEDSRAYSADPERVAVMVAAALQGAQKEGILPALKHFPGIGRGSVDSHRDISEISVGKEEIENVDLLPFRRGIEAADGNPMFVLVSHLKYPALDAERPASLSKAILTGLLRGEMGYDGLIVTDDMEMGAISNYEKFREVGVKAIAAGADMVMICHEYEHQREAYLGVLEAVEKGEISEARIDDSVRRILRAKLHSEVF